MIEYIENFFRQLLVVKKYDYFLNGLSLNRDHNRFTISDPYHRIELIEENNQLTMKFDDNEYEQVTIDEALTVIVEEIVCSKPIITYEYSDQIIKPIQILADNGYQQTYRTILDGVPVLSYEKQTYEMTSTANLKGDNPKVQLVAQSIHGPDFKIMKFTDDLEEDLLAIEYELKRERLHRVI